MLTTLPLFFTIVAVTVTVYTPAVVGVVQTIYSELGSKVINEGVCGEISAVYTISDTEQLVDPETVN